ncbi:protein yippee-like At5g53940 isoform X1 [Ipomoea triloba]|uniref:protein yippee-like At5g53940 isoform X1 n=1 Tax=Ipomoea triloba TaxID=35885 RepID=UPI00125D92D1|nr:protein yippee-like At5g53940 isoform X1 [Ipomoea triloba]GLL16492.1 protein yippee-like At5g53940 isoform X1 [Ipomoea trifida]GMC55595.1 protein yippee-like At5g53940 [Ipomoea batatas]
MGRIFVVDLEGRTYNCKFCKTQLALADDLVSRAFHCRRGKAYLFNNVVNNMVGPLEERMMLSGMHTVADIFCCCCGQIIGWKYEAAHEKSQKYKEGKFVLERGRIIDGGDSEFYIGNHPILSDAEDA